MSSVSCLYVFIDQCCYGRQKADGGGGIGLERGMKTGGRRRKSKKRVWNQRALLSLFQTQISMADKADATTLVDWQLDTGWRVFGWRHRFISHAVNAEPTNVLFVSTYHRPCISTVSWKEAGWALGDFPFFLDPVVRLVWYTFKLVWFNLYGETSQSALKQDFQNEFQVKITFKFLITCYIFNIIGASGSPFLKIQHLNNTGAIYMLLGSISPKAAKTFQWCIDVLEIHTRPSLIHYQGLL